IATSATTAIPMATTNAVRPRAFGGGMTASVGGRTACVVIASVLTEAIDEGRSRTVGVEPARDQVPGTHPTAMHPLAERDTRAGRARCSGNEFHSLERVSNALG